MRRAFLVVSWLLFVFLLLEGAGFLFYKLEVSKPISGYGYPPGLFVEHPQLDYLYQPEFSGYFKGSAYQDIPIEINARGFRDDDFGEIETDEMRIAALGDSVVFGSGVRAEDRFTQCLDTTGDGHEPGRRILNLGVNGYSFAHYLALAKLDFLGLRPGAVLVGITLNDFAPKSSSGPARRLRRHAEGLHKPDWVARIQQRIGRTYAVRFVREIETRLSYALINADQREHYHTKWMRSVVAGWGEDENRQRFAGELDDFLREMGKSGTPYAFLVFPELNELQNPQAFGSARTTVEDILAQRKLALCDLHGTFAAETDRESLFLERDSIHYSVKGHRLLCDTLKQCLDHGLLGKPHVTD